MTDQFKIYYESIQTILNEILRKKFPEILDRGDIYQWAKEQRRELYLDKKQLEAEVDQLWSDGGDIETFKIKVLSWGKCELRIYESFAQWVKENTTSPTQQTTESLSTLVKMEQ